jgi:hypothetical protein
VHWIYLEDEGGYHNAREWTAVRLTRYIHDLIGGIVSGSFGQGDKEDE